MSAEGETLSIAGLDGNSSTTMTGHARFLAGPAYASLEAIEPVLKRSIPILITIFLGVVFLARAMSLMTDRTQTIHDAYLYLPLIASSAQSAVMKSLVCTARSATT